MRAAGEKARSMLVVIVTVSPKNARNWGSSKLKRGTTHILKREVNNIGSTNWP